MEDGAAEVAVVDGGAAVEGVGLHGGQGPAGYHDGPRQVALLVEERVVADRRPAGLASVPSLDGSSGRPP